jgi:DNA polymerase-3 subunit gamma/tau
LSYLVLARKYRPRTFSDLVGQAQVTRTLTQALLTGRVAHAYLFTGPRGVGKTTAARLLAAALSCEGEGARPCGGCPRCLEIQSGRSVDVIEVDGASNRGINEIRGLRDTVKFLPARNRYKVYIIDEVHALTTEAFNALLKTLEEPPEHVVFVFATTEAHKLPATILSRCQRYDFRRIRVEDIAGRLRTVAEAEGIPCEPEALTALARQAEGGLRDALGLADQVAASDGELTLEAVGRSLGLVRRELTVRVASAAFRGDAGDALAALKDAYEAGCDFKELGLRTLEYVRDLALFKASPKAAEMLDLTDAEEREYAETVKHLSLSTLHRHFESWLKLYADLARHPQPRWLLESHLIRAAQTAPLEGLAELTARLTAILELEPEAVREAFRARPAPTSPPAGAGWPPGLSGAASSRQPGAVPAPPRPAPAPYGAAPAPPGPAAASPRPAAAPPTPPAGLPAGFPPSLPELEDPDMDPLPPDGFPADPDDEFPEDFPPDGPPDPPPGTDAPASAGVAPGAAGQAAAPGGTAGKPPAPSLPTWPPAGSAEAAGVFGAEGESLGGPASLARPQAAGEGDDSRGAGAAGRADQPPSGGRPRQPAREASPGSRATEPATDAARPSAAPPDPSRPASAARWQSPAQPGPPSAGSPASAPEGAPAGRPESVRQPWVTLSRAESQRQIEIIKATQEGAELIRQLPGSFIGYDNRPASETDRHRDAAGSEDAFPLEDAEEYIEDESDLGLPPAGDDSGDGDFPDDDGTADGFIDDGDPDPYGGEG